MKKRLSFWRHYFLCFIFLFLFIVIIIRLFYWQVLAKDKLTRLAKNQYQKKEEINALRGEILARDYFPLATNKKTYLLFASLKELDGEPLKIAEKLTPILLEKKIKSSSFSGDIKIDWKKKIEKEKVKEIEEKLKAKNLLWTIIERHLDEEEKRKIESLNLKGIGFEEELVRFYPEASMAAHLLGFVGKNEINENIGYFGIEGFYELELRGKPGLIREEKDPINRTILVGSFSNKEKKDGQTLILHLDRFIQFMVEEKLAQAIKKYRAKAGSVLVAEAQSGGILAMANYPTFEPENYFNYEKNFYKNPLISDTYEPGSTFKIIVMAAALDKDAVKVSTKCDICEGPIKIDRYEIRTWNNKYYPQSNMAEVLQHSDNLGMIFVIKKLGLDGFWEYLENFGFGRKTNIDLQGEIAANLKPKNQWTEVDLATASFGQGIAVTAIQMLQACSVIANQGKLIEPKVVKEILTADQKIEIKPHFLKQVIKPETASLMTNLMVQAVEKGETKKLKLAGYKIAGKTGTAEIPVAGHYDEEKTIASFIGFAPADKPKFIMLTMLREPETSPWGSETAAPLFFEISREILQYYGIPPQ